MRAHHYPRQQPNGQAAGGQPAWHVRISGRSGNPLDELDLREPVSPSVEEIDRVPVHFPDCFQPHATGPLNPELQAAVSAAPYQAGLIQTELVQQDVFRPAQGFVNVFPQVIQGANRAEILGHGVFVPISIFPYAARPATYRLAH